MNEIFSGFTNELSLILEKKANIPSASGNFGDAAKSVGNYMKGTISRQWNMGGNGTSGMINKGLTIGAPLMLNGSQALEKEDPQGLGRSRPERITGLAGNVAGGMVGMSMGTDMGNAMMKGLDPTDKYMGRAMTKAQTVAAANPIKPQKFTDIFKSHPEVATVGNKIKALGWKGRLASLGLRALPTVGGMYMAGKAGQIGENVASAPFKLFRNKQPIQQPVQEPQPIS